MADKSDQGTSGKGAAASTDTKAKPTVLPDLTNYVVPSVEVLLISGFGVILLNYALGWGLFGRDQSAIASQQRLKAMDRQAVNNQIATNQIATNSTRSTGPVVQASETEISSGQAAANQAAANPTVTNQTMGLAGTHRVICNSGNQGLNFRPTAGFSTPLFAIPCGTIVAVTGNAINVQNETWSPVNYGGRSGWSASKLLQPLR
jgi:hypothetical protein